MGCLFELIGTRSGRVSEYEQVDGVYCGLTATFRTVRSILPDAGSVYFSIHIL
jgi:hypothetical protein